MAESSSAGPTPGVDPALALMRVLQMAGIQYSITAERDTETPDDTILLQAADGAQIPISRSLLSSHSSFFADLPSFLEADAGETPVFPLPNATSAGLDMLVRLLPYVRTTDRGESHDVQLARIYQAPLLGEIGWDDLPTLQEAVSIARTYEMDDAVRAAPYAAWQPDRPLFNWALMALTQPDEVLTGDDDLAVRRALRSTEVLPPAAEDLLQHYAPKALRRYLGMRTGWAEVTVLLRTELDWNEPMKDGREDYMRKCEGFMGLRRCAAREKYPRWEDLRKVAAEKVYEFAIHKYDPPPTLSLVTIQQVVPCVICAQRLDDTFARPINDFWNSAAAFAI